jgi:hypothetical protein
MECKGSKIARFHNTLKRLIKSIHHVRIKTTLELH